VAKRLMSLVLILLLFAALAIGLAWYDGGREEQRLIVEPIELPEQGA